MSEASTRSCAPGLLAALTLSVVLALESCPPVFAAGTSAGTLIQNQSQVNYVYSGSNLTTTSNTTTLRVDELLNVTLASNDAGAVVVSTPDDDDPLSFTLTNPGNGSEAYGLIADPSVVGDQYDPTDTRIFLDDGDGVFEPAQDTLHSSGNNDPVLAPDQSRVVFVVNDTPAGRTSGDLGRVALTATAVTGSGAPGTTFVGQGTAGVDAVVGATSAMTSVSGTYTVSQIQSTLVKIQAVQDPLGGASPVQGAIVTYTLTFSIGGAGTAAGTQLMDAVPAGTTYVADSLRQNGTPLTDAADGDAGRFTGNAIEVFLGAVTAPATHVIEFRARIN